MLVVLQEAILASDSLSSISKLFVKGKWSSMDSMELECDISIHISNPKTPDGRFLSCLPFQGFDGMVFRFPKSLGGLHPPPDVVESGGRYWCHMDGLKPSLVGKDGRWANKTKTLEIQCLLQFMANDPETRWQWERFQTRVWLLLGKIQVDRTTKP